MTLMLVSSVSMEFQSCEIYRTSHSSNSCGNTTPHGLIIRRAIVEISLFMK